MSAVNSLKDFSVVLETIKSGWLLQKTEHLKLSAVLSILDTEILVMMFYTAQMIKTGLLEIIHLSQQLNLPSLPTI